MEVDKYISFSKGHVTTRELGIVRESIDGCDKGCNQLDLTNLCSICELFVDHDIWIDRGDNLIAEFMLLDSDDEDEFIGSVLSEVKNILSEAVQSLKGNRVKLRHALNQLKIQEHLQFSSNKKLAKKARKQTRKLKRKIKGFKKELKKLVKVIRGARSHHDKVQSEEDDKLHKRLRRLGE